MGKGREGGGEETPAAAPTADQHCGAHRAFPREPLDVQAGHSAQCVHPHASPYRGLSNLRVSNLCVSNLAVHFPCTFSFFFSSVR